MAEVTKSELLKDDTFIKAVTAYGADRHQKVYESREEAVDDFLEDYRSMQSNSLGLLNFINYAEGLEDGEYKKSFAAAYEKLDNELENVFTDESTSKADAAKAVWDYAFYTIADPVNLLGVGVGKAISLAAARTLAKPLITKALASKIGTKATTPWVKAAAASAVGEGAIEAGFEGGLQQAEIDLGIRTEYDAGEMATSAAIGAAIGGGIGGLVAKYTDQGLPETVRMLSEAKARAGDTPQERAFQKSGGLYMTLLDEDEFVDSGQHLRVLVSRPEAHQNPLLTGVDPDIIENTGRVRSIEGDTATVEYRNKNEDGAYAPINIQVKLADLKVVNEAARARYIKDKSPINKYLDRSSVSEQGGIKQLEGLTPEEMAEVTRLSLRPDVMRGITQSFRNMMEEDPRLTDTMDLDMDTLTESVAKIFDTKQKNSIDGQFDREDVLGEFLERLTENGVTPDQFGNLLRAEMSLAGKTLGSMSSLVKRIGGSADEAVSKAKILTMAEDIKASTKRMSTEQKAQMNYLEVLRKEEAKFQTGFMGKLVDFWRGMIVSQPVTTTRNIIGSAVRAPGEEGKKILDNWMATAELEALGYSAEDAARIAAVTKTDTTSLLSRLVNPSEAIELATHVKDLGGRFSEVDNTLFRAMGDFNKGLKGAEDDGAVVQAMGWLAHTANFLNRKQDTYIKSAGFISSLDHQINRAARFAPDPAKAPKTLKEAIEGDKMDVVSHPMVVQAMTDAHKLTYQVKRAGDDSFSPVVGGFISTIQVALNSNPRLKQLQWVIAFPNFLANSLVYWTNRLPVLSLVKGYRGSKLKASGKITPEERTEFTALNKQMDEYKATAKREWTKEDFASFKVLEQQRDGMMNKLAQTQEGFRLQRESIVETLEGVALLGAAYALRSSEFAGSDWWAIEDPDTGTITDARPIFPLAQFLFMAELARRHIDGETAGAVPMVMKSDMAGAMFGVSVRSGVIGKLMRKTIELFQSDDSRDYAVAAQLAGEVFGSVVSGVLTPLR